MNGVGASAFGSSLTSTEFQKSVSVRSIGCGPLVGPSPSVRSVRWLPAVAPGAFASAAAEVRPGLSLFAGARGSLRVRAALSPYPLRAPASSVSWSPPLWSWSLAVGALVALPVLASCLVVLSPASCGLRVCRGRRCFRRRCGCGSCPEVRCGSAGGDTNTSAEDRKAARAPWWRRHGWSSLRPAAAGARVALTPGGGAARKEEPPRKRWHTPRTQGLSSRREASKRQARRAPQRTASPTGVSATCHAHK